MTAKSIRRSLFKVLRKVGVPKSKINENASLEEDLFWDEVDVTCFMYHLESNFNIELQRDELGKLYSVKDTINYLTVRCA